MYYLLIYLLFNILTDTKAKIKIFIATVINLTKFMR